MKNCFKYEGDDNITFFVSDDATREEREVFFAENNIFYNGAIPIMLVGDLNIEYLGKESINREDCLMVFGKEDDGKYWFDFDKFGRFTNAVHVHWAFDLIKTLNLVAGMPFVIDEEVVVSNDGEEWENRSFAFFSKDADRKYYVFMEERNSLDNGFCEAFKYCKRFVKTLDK